MIIAFFYPAYILIALIIVLIYVPKKDIKEYFIYGLICGGLGDVVVVAVFQNLLHAMWFKNAGIFNVMGQNLLSPPSWILTVIIFLRFLPQRRLFLYLYVLTFAAFSVGYGYLVQNVGLFDFKPWLYPFVSYLTFLGWWVFISWFFRKTSPLAKKDSY